MPSKVYTITSTDLLATNPTISSATTIPSFVVRGLAPIYSTVSSTTTICLMGALVEGNNAYQAVMRYPGTLVYRSTKGRTISGGTAAELFNMGIATFWPSSKSIQFLSSTDADSWDPIVELDTDQFLREVASFNSKQFSYNDINTLAICEWNGRFYCFNGQRGTIHRTLAIRGVLGTDFDSGNSHGSLILKLSDMGRNTSLINKSLFSVIVEVSEPLTTNYDLTVTVNDIVVGTITAADTVQTSGGLYRKEIVLTSELTASIFTPKIIAGQDNPWTGYVKFVMLKYVPTQFKKRAWGMGIRATKRLVMGDGAPQARTAAQMFADIEAAWASNTPISFIDVDGTTYTVIVTDFKQKRPLLQIGVQSDNESFFFIEVLEV